MKCYPNCPCSMKIIPVINGVFACTWMSAEDKFSKERGMCIPNDFISEFLCFGLSDITLFQVTLGLH